MDWAVKSREAYRAIHGAYEGSRRSPLLTADLAPRGVKALDLGSGRGAQPRYLESEYPYVVHCDLAQELIPPGSEAVLCEATMLPFRDGSFDVIHAVAVYHHLPPIALTAALREAVRVGRLLVATVWALPGGGGVMRVIPWRWRAEADRVYYVYSIADLINSAAVAGAKVLSIGYMRRGRRLNVFLVAERIN